MTAHSIIKKAADLGVALVVTDGHLKGRGVRPDPAFLAELRAHEAEIIALLAADPYWKAFAAFKEAVPYGTTRFRHDQAVWAADKFLTEWAPLAAEFGWTADDIFSLPRGLAYWLETELVRSLGPDHAVAESGRVFDRVTRSTWINPYRAETKQ